MNLKRFFLEMKHLAANVNAQEHVLQIFHVFIFIEILYFATCKDVFILLKCILIAMINTW